MGPAQCEISLSVVLSLFMLSFFVNLYYFNRHVKDSKILKGLINMLVTSVLKTMKYKNEAEDLNSKLKSQIKVNHDLTNCIDKYQTEINELKIFRRQALKEFAKLKVEKAPFTQLEIPEKLLDKVHHESKILDFDANDYITLEDQLLDVHKARN